MKKFAVGYASLQSSLEKPKVYKLEDVKDKIKKVVFDVVRFLDSDNIDGLWQIQHTFGWTFGGAEPKDTNKFEYLQGQDKEV